MDEKPRHEAYSYASAGDIEPAEEFPILYRLLTAEGKATKRPFSSSTSFINNSPNHSYFPINSRNRQSRKNSKGNSGASDHYLKKDNLISSTTVEADSTSDISLSHILARNKFTTTIGRNSSSNSKTNNTGGRRKGKRVNENNKDSLTNDEMLPSSTTKDDEDDYQTAGDYFYNQLLFNSPPPRKRGRFPANHKRAFILKKSLQAGRQDMDDDDGNNVEDEWTGQQRRQEVQESLLVSSLSVNERLSILLGQQQVNTNNDSSRNINSIETKPPSLVPPLPSANIFLNNTQSNNRNNTSNVISDKEFKEGALRTLLSRPPSTAPSSLASSHRQLIFPISTHSDLNGNLKNNSIIAEHHANETNDSSSSQSFLEHQQQISENDQKKILIKGVVEQLRAAATQRLNSLYSFKRSLASSTQKNAINSLQLANSNENNVGELIQLHKCPHCDLTFKRLYHLSRHEALVHMKPEKLFCSLCSKEFSTKEHFQLHVEECFDMKYPTSASGKIKQEKADDEDVLDGKSTIAKYTGHKLHKQYIGLSELLETKVEDSSSFHSFVLPTKYLE